MSDEVKPLDAENLARARARICARSSEKDVAELFLEIHKETSLWKARATSAEATCVRLREALKPFAVIGAAFSEGPFAVALWPDDKTILQGDMRLGGQRVTLTLGDFRRAQNELSNSGKPQ